MLVQEREAIKAEVARRLEDQHGSLAETIAKEARQIALADHTFDVLADEVRLLAKASGIEPVSTEVLRIDYAAPPLFSPWSDPQNEDLSILRVRVRKEIIPILESTLGPGVVLALARSAALARDDADALDDWARTEFGTMQARSLEISRLVGLPRAVRTRILRLAIYDSGAPPGSLSADHITAVEALVSRWHGQGEVSLPGGVKVGRLSGRLSLLPHPN